MTGRLWLMHLLLVLQLKSDAMASDYLSDCFFEKRAHTALQGYNDLNDRWLSDFDCFDRCMRSDRHKCRSFEHWHREGDGLCVRANISLTDYPLKTGYSAHVDYYEINCRRNVKALHASAVHCPGDQLFLTVKLNGIHAEHVQLGDTNCKPSWSNETHAQFITNIDNCSLIVTNSSIVGKLRWAATLKDGNASRHFGRFFVCASAIYQIRMMQHMSTVPNHRHTLSMLPNRTQNQHDEQKVTSPYRIHLHWTLNNRSYDCPETCFISLFSLLNITLVDLSLITSKYSIDSCDLQALSPYTHYLQSKRLISQGCSIDPTVIHVPGQLSSSASFHFSFYLYHILKEPIPFQIQCKILHNDENIELATPVDCASVSALELDRPAGAPSKNDKRDYFYTLFRSSSVYVTRQFLSIESEQQLFHTQKTIISIATVHYTECSLLAFCVLMLYAV